MGLVLNWAQVVVVWRGFGGVRREREGVVQSAARGITEVAVGMASWRVPPGERILCSQKGSCGPGKWTGS